MRLRTYSSNGLMQLYLELDQRDMFILHNSERARLVWNRDLGRLEVSPGDDLGNRETNKILPQNDLRKPEVKKTTLWDGEHRVYISANKIGLPTLRDSEGHIDLNDKTKAEMIDGRVALTVPVPRYLY